MARRGERESYRRWSQEEKDFLMDKWGTYSRTKIANTLHRTEKSIINMAQQLKLGPVLMGSDFVSLNQILGAIGYAKNTTSTGKSWRKRGLKVHMRRVSQNKYLMVNLDDWWEWAYTQQSRLDFKKFPQNALGLEPDWVDIKRRADQQSNVRNNYKRWTDEELRIMRAMIDDGKTYEDISRAIGRTSKAIYRMCARRGYKLRPRGVDRREAGSWTREELRLMEYGIKHGYKADVIAAKIGIGVMAVSAKVVAVYGTTDLDKIRALMDGHEFGYGAPERNGSAGDG